MKKKILFLVIFAFLMCGCKKEPMLVFQGQRLEDDLVELYQINENQKVYSMYTEIKYNDHGKEIDLKEALENNKITIDDIISKMTLHDKASDGGSLWYQYETKDNNLANMNFILMKCDSNEGNGNNKNIYIGDDEKLTYYCAN